MAPEEHDSAGTELASAIDKNIIETRFLDERQRQRERLDDLQRLYTAEIAHVREIAEAKFEASEIAISKAQAATEKRFESINEFRGQLADQQATFLRREIFDAFQGTYVARHDDLLQRIQAMQERVTA